MLVLNVTEMFIEDLKEWLFENVDDGWGKWFVYWEEDDQLEIISEMSQLAIKNIKEESLVLDVDGKYKRSGYYSMQLKPEHFLVEVYNPFTNAYQTSGLNSNK